MGITLKTDKSQIKEMIKQKFDKLEQKIINSFIMTGEKAVVYARNVNTYKDRTGNLRSSIGYVVAKRGVVVAKSAFNQVRGPEAEGALDGGEKGEAYATEIAKRYIDSIVLVVVAGMEYAVYVERKHGLDVIGGAQLDAEKNLKKFLKAIKID